MLIKIAATNKTNTPSLDLTTIREPIPVQMWEKGTPAIAFKNRI